MNKRRKLFMALGGVLALPRLALAQQAERIYRIGWLFSLVNPRTEAYSMAFEQRLHELGFAEGRNLAIEFRAAEGRIERLPELAAELARLNCDVFLATGAEAFLAAFEQASRDTPIVMIAIDYDPVASGHVASLARPGGRTTGISVQQLDLAAKRLELMKELLPKAKRIAVFSNTGTLGQLKSVQAAAKRLGVALQVVEFKSAPYDYDSAFAEAVRARAQALLVLTSSFFVPARRQIPELALKHRLPSMFGNAAWANAGGLLSYAPNFSEFYRRAAEQVSLILKGANPANMPVEQPTQFEFVINLKTAKALGVTIPQSIRFRADRVIE